MRRALAILTILACAALAAFTPTKPKVPPVAGLTLTGSKLSATTVTIKGCWTSAGGPDGFVTTGTAAGQATQTHTLGVVACDSFTFTAPAPGLTATGSFAVVAKRRGLSSASVSKTWTYTEPDVPPPPPTIDSVFARPASLSVLSDSYTRLCMVWAYSDHTFRLSNQDNGVGGFRQDTIPGCQAVTTALAMGG